MSRFSHNNQTNFYIKEKIYPLEAIYLTCYAFFDRAYVFLDENRKTKQIKVTLKPKLQPSTIKSDILKGEFMNELLNNTLRLAISRRNARLREYVVRDALYFSKRRKNKQTKKFKTTSSF